MAHRPAYLLFLTFLLLAQQPRSLTVPELRNPVLVHRVGPHYNSALRIAGIYGAVVLEAEISESGTVDFLKLISGHLLLVNAAIDAAKQWRFKPATRGGQAIPSAITLWVYPDGRSIPELAPTESGASEGASNPSRVDLSRFAGVWDGEWRPSGDIRVRKSETKVTWTIGFRDGRLIRTDQRGSGAAYELDGSEIRSDGFSRAIKEISKSRIELVERQLPSPGAANVSYTEIDESWLLSEDGNSLSIIQNRGTERGRGLARTYAFHRRVNQERI